MAISAIGIGSGLKVDEILNDLRKVENKSLELVQNRQIANTQRISGYGALKGSVENLQNAAAKLNNPATFGAVKVGSNNEAITATGSAKASPGRYAIDIESLATSQTLMASGQASRTEAIGQGGTITITLQNGDEHVIDLSDKNTSLESVMQAINDAPDLGVSATLINDGSGTPHRLLITAKETGTEGGVAKIRVSDNDELAEILSFTQDPAANDDNAPAGAFTETAAVNAHIRINGIDIEQQSNVLEDVIEGLKIDISKAKAGDTVNLTVSRDDSVAKKAIKDFVEAYNALNATSRELTHYDVDNRQGSALTGDSMVRRIQNAMHQALAHASPEGEIRTLSKMGITSDPSTGELKIDDKMLDAALRDNLGDVKRLFMGDDGLGKRVELAGKQFTEKRGIIDQAIEGATRTDKLLQDQYDLTAKRIDDRMEAYRRQFAQLDRMMTDMKGLSSYLTEQLNMLSNMNSNK